MLTNGNTILNFALMIRNELKNDMYVKQVKKVAVVIKHLFSLPLIHCTLALVCFYTAGLQAQSYITDIRKLSVEDGLSNRFITAIHKDSRGFMWFGTKYGLNRYDGYTFTHYTTVNSNIVFDHIYDILEDKEQRLWLLYKRPASLKLDDIYILDLQTDSIQSFEQVFKDKAPFTPENIRVIRVDDQKHIWIITAKEELYRYAEGRFEHVFSLSEPGTGLIHTTNEQVWFWGKDIFMTDMQARVLKRFPAEKDMDIMGFDEHHNFWFFQFHQKKLLRGNTFNDSLRVIDLKTLKLPGEIYMPSVLQLLHIEHTGPAWYYKSTGSVFLLIHPQKGVVLDLYNKMKPFSTYGELNVADIYMDAQDRAWIASDDGVFIITLKENKFTTLLSEKTGNYSARGITKDLQGNLYINTYGGRIRFNSEKGKINKESKQAIRKITMGVYRDSLGFLWFSGDWDGIEKYDPLRRHSQYYEFPYDSTGDAPLEEWVIIRDRTGRVWTGAARGLCFLNPDTGLYRRFTRYNAFPSLGESKIYHLSEDEEGIWIASSSGLYLLEPGKGITLGYGTGEAPPRYIPYDHILHFYRDKEGIFWLATRGGGLIRFNPKDGSYRQFTVKDGLSSPVIYAVYEDDYGKLWLPGNYGLMQFDKQSHRVTTYLTDDGIAHNEFNTVSHYRDADGKLYFGGLAGVTVLDPKDFTTEDSLSVPLRITRCQVLNGKTGELSDKTREITRGESLVLSPSDKSVLVEFALLNYGNTAGNSYTYKIEGLDKTWTVIQENRLRINALPYGAYTLRIKGRGLREQSAGTLSIPIVAKKPFYLKNGFILSAAIALVLLIYGIFYWRLQSLKRAKTRLQQTVKQRTLEIEQQAEKLRELNATQSRWFINIAHELRTPLTLILGPIRQFLKKQPAPSEKDHDIQLAEKNTLSLLNLVNEILDISRLESNRLQLNKAPTGLGRLIREATAHFESFARQKQVRLTTRIPEDLEMNIDKDRIRNILVNLISNALKFTHAGGKVEVSMENKVEEGIIISVTDTGDGIPEKDLPHVFERYFQASDPERINPGGAGIGLSLSLELARLHGGNLTAESQLGKGSVFSLWLPRSLMAGAGKPAAMPLSVTLPEEKPDVVAHPSKEKQDKSLILLVEDNPDMRQYIRSFMHEKYRIDEAADGVEALEYLEKNLPDLIISDIMMPRMDGIALARTLKNEETLKNLPFITLTARSGEADKIAALRIGIDDYLTKPFNPEELEARAANLIRNYKARRAVSPTDPGEIAAPGHREALIEALREEVLRRLEDPDLTAEALAASRNMSLSSLRRFLKDSTGLSPGRFIREIRLQQARRLLEAGQHPSVAEVMYAVGFEKASYFSKVFSERFGKSPSGYL